jgi:hypothetical protein
MSPRRQDSQETLRDEILNIGDDKLDGTYCPSFHFHTQQWLTRRLTRLHNRSKAIPLDPFLVVQSSLNNSLLVKQGLVEETPLPQPTHSAYDIQVRFTVCLINNSR